MVRLLIVSLVFLLSLPAFSTPNSQISGSEGGEFFRFTSDQRGIRGDWRGERFDLDVRRFLNNSVEIRDLYNYALNMEIDGGPFYQARGRSYCGELDVRVLGNSVRGFACGIQVDGSFSSTREAVAAFKDIVGNAIVMKFPYSVRGGIKELIYNEVR